MDLAFYPGDLRQRLAKIHLRMTGIVAQRANTSRCCQPVCPHIVLYDSGPTSVAVLLAQPFEDPLAVCCCFFGRPSSAAGITSMIPITGSSFGRAGGRRRRYQGGTEKAKIFATVRVDPKTPRASRRLHFVGRSRTRVSAPTTNTAAKAVTPLLRGAAGCGPDCRLSERRGCGGTNG